VIVFGALSLAACGGDEESGAPAGQGGAAGVGGGATGGSSGVGGTPVMPLPADTAGKACAADTECAPGTCATMVEGLDGMPLAAPGGYCMGSCMASAECGAGGTCVPGLTTGGAGLCYDMCSGDMDCRQGYLCGPLTSTCRPAPPTDQLTDNQAGLACAGDAECGDGTCLTMRLSGEPFPGGYCSGACLMDSHCGVGGVCWRAGGAAGRCYDACAADPDCTREGYRCRDITDTIKGCLPAADPLPDNTAGKLCAADADCGGAMGSCAAMLPAVGGGEVAAPGGYCTVSCEIDTDCGLEGLCVATRGGAFCFDPCAMQTDCRDGYTCGERGGMDMPSLVCTPIQPDDGGVPDPDGGTVADAGL
jgi:hypothetical protein